MKSAVKISLCFPRVGTLAAALVAITLLPGSLSGASPVPFGPYLNGLFPAEVPGTSSGFSAVNAFPNLRFIGPVWLTDYPGTNDLVVTSKAGHIWRFDNNPNLMPADVKVMLNFSK